MRDHLQEGHPSPQDQAAMHQSGWFPGQFGEPVDSGFTLGALENGEDERSSKKFRRSCDRCTAKKIKCDGMASCENCVKRGYQCNYSARKRTGPRIKTAQEEHPEWAQNMSGARGLVPWLGGDGRISGSSSSSSSPNGTPRWVASLPGGAAGYGPTPFGLGPFTPSPFVPNALSQQPMAQLIRREEGGYLENFLRDFNTFLPLTDEAVVRAALVQLLSGGHLPVSSMRMQSSVLSSDVSMSIEQVQLSNSHNAILWGAIAIGALMAGATNAAVNGYASLAWLSVKECFDYAAPSTVSAYLVMSVLFQFLGEVNRHRRYLGLADQLFKELGSSAENIKMAIHFLKVGNACDLGMTEAGYRAVMNRELPEPPALRALGMVTKVKAGIIFCKHESDRRMSAGLPKYEMDVASMVHDMQLADGILQENSAASSSSYGICYERGLLGVLVFWLTNDVQQSITYMRPMLDVVARQPGVARMLPCWHFVHCLGLFLLSSGDEAGYHRLHEAQSSVAHGDLTALPPLDQNPLHETNSSCCEHPICMSVWSMVQGQVTDLPLGAPAGGASASPMSSASSAHTSSADEVEAPEAELFAWGGEGDQDEIGALLENLASIDQLGGELPVF